jgi:hypothetical protein
MLNAKKQIDNKRTKRKILSYIKETLMKQLLIVITIQNSNNERYDHKEKAICYQKTLIDALH